MYVYKIWSFDCNPVIVDASRVFLHCFMHVCEQNFFEWKNPLVLDRVSSLRPSNRNSRYLLLGQHSLPSVRVKIKAGFVPIPSGRRGTCLPVSTFAFLLRPNVVCTGTDLSCNIRYKNYFLCFVFWSLLYNKDHFRYRPSLGYKFARSADSIPAAGWQNVCMVVKYLLRIWIFWYHNTCCFWYPPHR